MRINSVQNYNIYSQNGSKSDNKNQTFGYGLPCQAEPIIERMRSSFSCDAPKLREYEKALSDFFDKRFDAKNILSNYRLKKDDYEFIAKLDMPKKENYAEKIEIVPQNLFKRCWNYLCGNEPETHTIREHVSTTYDYKNIAVEIDFLNSRENFLPYAESPYEDYHYLILRSGNKEFPIKIWESDNIPSEFDTEFLEKYLSSPSGIQNLSNLVDEGMEKMILSEIDNKYFNDHFEELFLVKNPIEDLK
jgi:hypothetical protein